MRTTLLVLSTLVLLGAAAPTAAQSCGAGQILLKNDVLPDVPSGAYPVAPVRGLCDGEAAMSVFQTGGPVTVYSVAVLFAHQQGTNGAQAAADVEIYDGITALGGGRWQLGPLAYRLSSGGSNIQITSTGINAFTLPTPVRVTSGQLVVGFRMVQNISGGSCQNGYFANFAVDVSGRCTPGRNVLDATGHGPVDPATYAGFGLPLCPLFFNGDWVIRACVQPELTVSWAGNPTPGGFVNLTLNAPGHGSETYLVMVSNGIGTGTVTPWGRIPLDSDWLFSCFFDICRTAMLLNGYGTLTGTGGGFGALQIPALPVLAGSGLTMHVAFVTSLSPALLPFSGISTPSSAIVIN
ncbi:MAG: hypothetical protein IPM29_04305 [Planctomycetes bacterium]|nr:hypothetical protein [Planctomycetota bacterium]